MPEKKLIKKTTDNKAKRPRNTKRAVSVVKKTAKTTTKKKIENKTKSRSIKELLTSAKVEKLELKLFEPAIHFISETIKETIEAPLLFMDDEKEKVSPVTTTTNEVIIKQSTTTHKAQHILDLSESEFVKQSTDGKTDKNYKDLESFMMSSDEDGLWQTMVMFMKGETKSMNGLHNFLNLTIVSWLALLVRIVFVIIKPIVKIFILGAKFLYKGTKDYIKMLVTILRLVLHGRLNRDNLLNPEQALVDVSLFPELEPEPKVRLQLQFNAPGLKSLTLFLILAIVIILPVKGMAFIDVLQKEKASVLGVSEDAYSSLQLAVDDIQNFSWLAASEHFQDSQSQFVAVYNQFQDSHNITRKILEALPNTKSKIETAENLIQVGIDISLLGEKVTDLLSVLQSEEEGILLTGKIRAIQTALDEIRVIQERISEHFVYIDIEDLPEDIQNDVMLLKETLPKVFSSLSQIEELMNFAYILLGGDKQQRYILAFQNSDEIRATGGFMGSLTTATLYQGEVMDMETPGGGPYDWQAWIQTPTVAPRPLWLVNPVWQFQDANWFADFPSSAQKILSFYKQTRPERIDGVIAINSYILPEIIRLIGDIELPEYDKVLTPENVLYEIQSAVELEYDLEENKPKKIIGDLFEVITQRLLEEDDIGLIDVLQIINKGLLERDIQMYFVHPELQEKVHSWRWSGELQNTSGDYLMLVNSNIGGAKTDKFMSQESILDSYIQPDGSIINELIIRRTNNGIPGDIFYGHNNVDYLRVYVPTGSEIVDVVGNLEPPGEEFFEAPPVDVPADSDLQAKIILEGYDESGVRISNQFNKTVFGLWLQTNLAETSEIKIRYRVPVEPITISTESNSPVVQKIDEFLRQSGVKDTNENKIWYSMYWQKQSGHHNHTIDYTLHFPGTWEIEHTARPGFVAGTSIEYQTLLEQDFSSGFLFGL